MNHAVETVSLTRALATHFSSLLAASSLLPTLESDVSPSDISVGNACFVATAEGVHASAHALLRVCAALRLDAALIICEAAED